MTDWSLVVTLLRRELRGGFRGVYVFLASLFLGVATVAGVGSVGSSVTAGLKVDGQRLLGGDADLRLLHRDATDAQRTWLQANTAALSEVIKMRAMARPVGRSDSRSLVEMKAVDGAYPLAGQFIVDPHRPLQERLI